MSSTHIHYLKEKRRPAGAFHDRVHHHYTLKAFTPPVKSYLNVGLPVMVPSL